MTVEDKAKQLAATLIGEDQNPQPLIEVLIEMAAWQRKQMLKNAVSRVVYIGDDSCPFLRRYELAYDIKTQVPDIKEGDKVKMIIVKED